MLFNYFAVHLRIIKQKIMQQKIKLITEAFSMQPSTLEVKQNEPSDNKLKNHYIKEIKVENFQELVNGRFSEVSYYVGYNWLGQIIFKYLQHSVNVHYYYE